MTDWTKPLKLEDSLSEVDIFPTEIDPTEDGILGESFGIIDQNTTISKTMDNDLQFKDPNTGIILLRDVKMPTQITVTSPLFAMDNRSNFYLADATSNNVSLKLPQPSASKDLVVQIKRIDSAYPNTVTIVPYNTELIEGEVSQQLDWLDAIKLKCDGTNWYVI